MEFPSDVWVHIYDYAYSCPLCHRGCLIHSSSTIEEFCLDHWDVARCHPRVNKRHPSVYKYYWHHWACAFIQADHR